MAKTQLSRDLAKDLIQKAEAQLKTLQTQGLKLKNTEKLFNDTKRAYDAKRLNETISNLNELGTKLNKLKEFSVEFSKIALVCHKGIKLADNMQMDTSKYNNQLNSAHELFDGGRFKEAINTAKECERQLVDGHFLYITDIVRELYNQLKELPKNIINSYDIQRRFNDTDMAIKNNDFALAWSITQQLQDINAELLEPFLNKICEMAKDKIIEFQNDIENARGKDVDLSDAKEIFSEMVERTKKASRISEFREIIEYTAAGKHALERALRRKARMQSMVNDAWNRFEPLLADFEYLQNHCAIPSSVEKMIKNLKEDIKREHFDTVMENIELCKQKMDKLRRASVPLLELNFLTRSLKSELWNRTDLAISNKGLASANDIKIQFSGPVETRRIPIIEILFYNSTETIEIGLKPEGAGSLPIDVDIKYRRSWDGKDYHEHHEIWLDINPPMPTPIPSQATYTTHPSPPAFTANAPTSQAPTGTHSYIERISCLYCQEPLEESEPIFKCKCGTIYHLSCITSLDICVSCGVDLKRRARQSPVIGNPKKGFQ